MSYSFFEDDSPFAGLTYSEAAEKFLRDHKMRISIRRRKKNPKKYSGHKWAFRITKSRGKFLASYFFTADGHKPTAYDVLSCLNADMSSEEDYYSKETWQPQLKKFFATKNIRNDLEQFW